MLIFNFVNRASHLEKPISQSRLAMVDVSDNAEIPNVVLTEVLENFPLEFVKMAFVVIKIHRL